MQVSLGQRRRPVGLGVLRAAGEAHTSIAASLTAAALAAALACTASAPPAEAALGRPAPQPPSSAAGTGSCSWPWRPHGKTVIAPPPPAWLRRGARGESTSRCRAASRQRSSSSYARPAACASGATAATSPPLPPATPAPSQLPPAAPPASAVAAALSEATAITAEPAARTLPLLRTRRRPNEC